MSTSKKLLRWVLPPLVGGLAEWATLITSNTPAPDSWTLGGLRAWCAIPSHWAFIIVGAIAGVGCFLGLRSLLGDGSTTSATGQDIERVLDGLETLKSALERNPEVATDVARDFGTAVDELARSDDPGERAAAVEVAEGNPVAAADRLMMMPKGGALWRAGRARQAARIYAPFAPSKALSAYEKAVRLDPTDVWTWIELGRLRLKFNSLREARQCFLTALGHVKNDRDRGVLENELGVLAHMTGDLGTAHQHFQAAHLVAKARAAIDPSDQEAQQDLAVSYHLLGGIEWDGGNDTLAKELFETAHDIRRSIASKAADDPDAQWDLATSLVRLADIEVDQGDLPVARQRLTEALSIVERFSQRNAADADWRLKLARTLSKLGSLEVSADNKEAARARYEMALPIFEGLVKYDSGNTEWKFELALCHLDIGLVYKSRGSYRKAFSFITKSLSITEELVALDQEAVDWHHNLFICNANLAQIAEARNDWAGAMERFAAAETIIGSLVSRRPDHPRYARDLGQVYNDIARLGDSLTKPSA